MSAKRIEGKLSARLLQGVKAWTGLCLRFANFIIIWNHLWLIPKGFDHTDHHLRISAKSVLQICCCFSPYSFFDEDFELAVSKMTLTFKGRFDPLGSQSGCHPFQCHPFQGSQELLASYRMSHLKRRRIRINDARVYLRKCCVMIFPWAVHSYRALQTH